MNREICGQCGQSLDPNWIDERIPKLEAMLREAIRERDSLRQHLHDEHQRHVCTMDERDAALADLAAARARIADHEIACTSLCPHGLDIAAEKENLRRERDALAKVPVWAE